MDFSAAIGPSEPLGFYLAQLRTLPRHWWLYVPDNVEEIEWSTPCRPLLLNTRDLSEEEGDEFDLYPGSIGLKSFLCPDQLEEIWDNLSDQTLTIDSKLLLAAVNYFWENDAFIVLQQ